MNKYGCIRKRESSSCFCDNGIPIFRLKGELYMTIVRRINIYGTKFGKKTGGE